MNKPKLSGFTLFEVMIALTILSIAMIAGVVTTTSVLERISYMEKKLLAHWVGMNVINSMQLHLLKDKMEVSTTTGSSKMRGQEFSWNLKITKAKLADVNVLKMQVTVSDTISGQLNSTQNIDSVTRHVTLLDTEPI